MERKILLIWLLSITSFYSFSQETVTISNNSLNTCSARIVDDGGLNGNYSETDYTMTVCADAGDELFMVINALRLSRAFGGNPDVFRVYDGNNTTGVLLFDSGNDQIGGIIMATTSCFTIELQTQAINAAGTRGSGFDLQVTCTLPETCSDGVLNNGEVLVDCGGPNCTPCFASSDCGSNVVLNGDFETEVTEVCTAGPDGAFGSANQIPRIWYDQTPVLGWVGTTSRIDNSISFPTADYFRNSCTNISSRSCMSGNGSVGFWAHFLGNENPEYVQTQLLEPLIAGREYCVSIIAETGQSDLNSSPDTDKLGFWFHNNTYTSGDGFVNITDDNGGQTFLGPGSVVNAQPQIINPTGQMISKPCKEFNYSFCAEGGEQYLVVGNFTPGGSASGDAEYIAFDNLVIKPSCPLDFDLTILGPTNCDASAFDITAETANQQGGCVFSNDFTYQWLLNGTEISGETNATLTNVSPDMDNIYSVDVTYNAGCSSITKNSIYPGPGQSNNAGTDSTLVICNTQSPIDLFTILGGEPETGGTWSPMLTSGTGVFDPSVDSPGDFTYMISGTAPCPDASATISVTVGSVSSAGEDGLLNICNSDPSVDLFSSLGGTPGTGGVWTPALTSGTGLFDPSVDSSGDYTYTISGTASCPESFATVTVNLSLLPDAGEEGMLSICNTESAVDLFMQLGGTPDAGGTWSPMLTSGTGVFDPSVDSPGDFTYTISGTAPCPDASATISVTVGSVSSAGEDGLLNICNSDPSVDLFSRLGGTPGTGGVWTPALTSGTGLFDPSVDSFGDYTYTISGTASCPESFATVTVNLSLLPDAGEEGMLSICNTESAVDLFMQLGGTPDAGGTWSPMLTSGTGVFDPSVDTSGTYTYSLTVQNCPTQESNVEVLVGVSEIADAGQDIVTCLDSVLLNATNNDDGRWACDAGIINGETRFNASLSGIEENSSITCTWTVTNEICGESSNQVMINRVGKITTPTIIFQGRDVSGGILDICEDETDLSLRGADPSATETGRWTITEGSSIILNNSLTQADQGNVTIEETGTTVLIWAINSDVPGCEEENRRVEIEVHAVPVAGINFDNEICQGLDVTITTDSLGSTDIGTWVSLLQPTLVTPPLEWVLLDRGLSVGQNEVIYSVVNDGCSARLDTATITIIDRRVSPCAPPEKEKLSAPNVFTPNGDGEHDTFFIRGIESYPNATVRIFNRWGAKVYQSDDYINNEWKGTDVPDGVYYYVIELSPDEEEGTGHAGVIHVIR